MKIHVIGLLLCLVPCVATAATERDDNARIGVNRVSMAGMRSIPNMSVNLNKGNAQSAAKGNTSTSGNNGGGSQNDNGGGNGGNNGGNNGGGDNSGGNGGDTNNGDDASCREAYRNCMDEFCLLDESEGYRCACSDNINKSKDLIQEIQKIQAEADKLYTEGVEREQLGAKVSLVFGQSEAAKKSSRASGLSFSEWLNSGSATDDSLGADSDIGDNLYAMAANYCASTLNSCKNRAEMEEALYSRQIVADCKSFESYLADQKINAQANKRTAEAAVRKARLEMLDTTNKYNRGECLLAYRSCIADKGGCGINFENCLDVDLLGRRANACENVLDQCMAVRSYVLEDWNAEAASILVEASKYADKYARQTCLARIQACLEDNCSTTTNSACLTNVNVAAGICTVITECEELVPGIRSAVNDKLGYLRTQFCQNDVDKCLRDKCGQNFTAPECIGKKSSEIAALCPQNMFPSCKNETQFDIIVQATLLQMDYRLMQGCLNYFGEELGKVCGTDMSCLPNDDTVESLMSVPDTASGLAELRSVVRNNAANAVNSFFAQFEKDKTVAACQDSQKPAGRSSLGVSVFNSAKMIANISAENRALRALESKVAELSRKQSIEEARQNCYNTYAVETPEEDKKNYSYIRSVNFEPDLRNCHVCRMQQVCETGGEERGKAATKVGLGMGASLASAGTMVSPGWGTAIGGVVGMVGGGLLGAYGISQRQDYCQEIESCEDVNM